LKVKTVPAYYMISISLQIDMEIDLNVSQEYTAYLYRLCSICVCFRVKMVSLLFVKLNHLRLCV